MTEMNYVYTGPLFPCDICGAEVHPACLYKRGKKNYCLKCLLEKYKKVKENERKTVPKR